VNGRAASFLQKLLQLCVVSVARRERPREKKARRSDPPGH
jgi:hypothetical protein